MDGSNSNNNPLGDLFSSIKDYYDLRTDEIKLILAENMAKIFSKMIYFFLIIITGGLALGFLATSFSSWLSVALDSKTLGALITGGIFVILMVVLYFFRNRLLMNSAVRMFIKIFFDNRKDGKGK